MDNPFKETSRSHRLFEALANADRPLRAEELAASVGEANVGVAHAMLKDLRGRGVTVYRYRDPNQDNPTASVYALHPVEGLTELATQTRRRGAAKTNAPPAPVRPDVRQPAVGSVARVTALLLHGEQLQARFECDGAAYVGNVAAAQPSVGEWLTLVTVGLHGQGLYVDLAGARIVTIHDITEVEHGAR